VKHTDEEIEAAARRFEEWADNLDPETAEVEDISDLRGIAEAADAVRRGEAQVVEQVAIARGRGRSWNQIALALGVSRQAARQRFTGTVAARTGARPRRSRAADIRAWAEHRSLPAGDTGADDKGIARSGRG
jgi:hypothetical protein